MRTISSISLALMLFISCGQKTFDSERQLLEFLQDEANGYMKYKTVNGVEFSLMYRPTDLLVTQEVGNDGVTIERVNELREKYKKYMYFNLSMSSNNQELLSTVPRDRNEFGAMVNRLAFGMQEKVHLFTEQKDTIELIDYIYPRMYGMSKATTMMFVFPRDKVNLEANILNFTIEDLDLSTGEIKFKINTERIDKEPRLFFKN